jgi:phosphatidylserine/phosphatidylglycerophosphate/cardiolipin synthase-like enzyme
VVDADAGDVAEVKAIFSADWDRRPPPADAYSQPRLVVSPVNARATLAALIASARRSLQIEDEEMYDAASEDALLAAARRGVSVEVVLPPPSGSSSYAPDVARLTAGGVHVRYLAAPYMHAKLVVADGALAFTGSENFSATSLDQNREVGLMIADPAALATFAHVFALDWALGADA